VGATITFGSRGATCEAECELVEDFPHPCLLGEAGLYEGSQPSSSIGEGLKSQPGLSFYMHGGCSARLLFSEIFG
jgi:hypothetical protein